jgi:O-antigen/teichoic acid export membrane protein
MIIDRSILHGVFGSVVLTAASVIASFVQFRLLVNALPQSVVGLWFLFLSIGGYLLFFDLGVSPTLGREISFCLGDATLSESQRAERIGCLIRSCTGAFAAIAALLLVVGTAGGWAYLGTVTPISLLTQIRWAWAIFVVGTAVSIVGEVWLASLYGMGQVATEKLVRSVGPILWLILTVVALRTRSGLPGLAVAWLVQSVVTRLIARSALTRIKPNVLSVGKFEFTLIRQLAIPGMKYAAIVLGGILILQTDNIVIASMLGTAEIPGYQAVAKLVTLMMSLSMMLVVTSAPFVSRAHARQDVVEIKRLLNRNLRFSLSIMAVIGCFLACFADRIIALWIGSHHFVGFGVVWVLIIVMLLEGHHSAMAVATMATGKLPFVAPALIAGVLNIVASVYLARDHGLLGVALGTLCAQVVTNNWYVPFYTMRLFRISFSQHFATVLFPVGKLFVALLVASLAARAASSGLSDFPTILVAGTVVVAVGFFVFVFVVLSSAERIQFLSLLRQSKLGKLLKEQSTSL